MSKLENLTASTVVEKKELKEVNGYGYILSHNKTKARVAVIENDDTNKDVHPNLHQTFLQPDHTHL